MRRIAIVGGIERNQGMYERIAAEAGAEVGYHGGHLRGRGPAALSDLVRRSELVIVLTQVNSHGAVKLARAEARRFGVPVVVQSRLSPSGLAALLLPRRRTEGAGAGVSAA